MEKIRIYSTVSILLVLALFSASCSKNDDPPNDIQRKTAQETPGQISTADTQSIQEITDIPASEVTAEAGETIPEPSANEVPYRFAGHDAGIVYQTFITSDVKVYLLPGFDSRVIEELKADTPVQIIGISDNREALESNSEFWVKISYGKVADFGDPNIGWILSSFTNIERDRLFVSDLKIVGTELNGHGQLVLHGTYDLNGSVVEFSVLPYKLEDQDFYTFSWDAAAEGFRYTNKPGIYIWKEAENEVRHITYSGGEGSKWGFAAWSILTDDFMYLIQDQGTSPDPRAVKVWRIEDGEEIFSGSYYVDINLRGHTIEIIRSTGLFYSEQWRFAERATDEELAFANKFIEENQPPENLPDGIATALLLTYDYNMDTGEKTLLGGQYIESM